MKKRLLKACRRILREYEKDIHSCDSDCPLCQIYQSPSVRCGKCPMTVFGGYIGCLDRHCRAISSKEIIEFGRYIEKEKLIAFYKAVIEWLESKSSKELANFKVFNELIEMDQRIYNQIK